MRLLSQTHDLREMRVINMGIHTEEPFEDILHHADKVLRERNADLRREEGLVI